MAVPLRSIRSCVVAMVALTMLAISTPVPASAAVVVRAASTATAPFGRYRPKVTSIARGTRVVFRAISGTHSVTSSSANWSINRTIDVSAATTFPQQVSFRFANRGTYRFRCRFHSTLVGGVCSGMCGRVVVG
jgi:plastocyanin